MESQRAVAAASSIELRLEIQDGIADLWTDHDRMLQVLENLIGNAVKYTNAPGRITVGAKQRDDEILFWISDTGEGIPSENVPHLFDRFWQANRADRRGAGLGLPIVKGIVEASGGRVWVESREGKGSTFFFTVPVIRGATAERGESPTLH